MLAAIKTVHVKTKDKILIIDHNDSFTFILADYFAQITKKSPIIVNHKSTSIEEIKKLRPSHIVLSPGPGTVENKDDFAIGHQILSAFEDKVPILGVCLGHQGIGAHYGARIIHVEPAHGKKFIIQHNKKDLFKNCKNPLEVMRYHSLAISPASIPPCIEVTATTKDGIIMGIRHKTKSIFGVQFHPESVGTFSGEILLSNFLSL